MKAKEKVRSALPVGDFNPESLYGRQFYHTDLVDTDLEHIKIDAEFELPSGVKYDIYRTAEKHAVSIRPEVPMAYIYCWRYPQAAKLRESIVVLEKQIISR